MSNTFPRPTIPPEVPRSNTRPGLNAVELPAAAARGPLVYVPRSHHLPYYEFSPGEYRYDGSRMGADEANAAMKFFDGQCERFGLAPKAFTAKKGDILFWHASLAHGGSPILDPGKTRKSFVVHFSTASTYPKRDIRLADDDRGGVWETREILAAGGARGYQNPARGRLAAG